MMGPVSGASVALIAQGILERKVKFGDLDASDFTNYQVPGMEETYREITIRRACEEAWAIVGMAEKTRPKH
jgi:hypothetical protein